MSFGDLQNNVLSIGIVQIRHVCEKINAKNHSFEYEGPHYINA